MNLDTVRQGELVLVLHGPSLGALGWREPDIYGIMTLCDIDQELENKGRLLGVRVSSIQSNHEGALIDAILDAPGRGVAGIIVNAAAYTHTSLAIADALRAAAIPAVEVHLSNIMAREAVRQRSLIAAACIGTVAGFGPRSYTLGLEGLVGHLRSSDSASPSDSPGQPKLEG